MRASSGDRLRETSGLGLRGGQAGVHAARQPGKRVVEEGRVAVREHRCFGGAASPVTTHPPMSRTQRFGTTLALCASRQGSAQAGSSRCPRRALRLVCLFHTQ